MRTDRRSARVRNGGENSEQEIPNGANSEQQWRKVRVRACPGPRGLKTLTLPDLPYDYGALKPHISGEIMQLHHQKHHKTYVTNFNNALENLYQAMNKGQPSTVVELQSAIKSNGGGRRWGASNGFVSIRIDDGFGSLGSLIQKMNAEGAALQGSGWVWLALDKDQKKFLSKPHSIRIRL